VLSGVLAGLDRQLLGDLGHWGALVAQGAGEGQHVVVDDLRTAAVVAFRRCGLLAFEGLLPDVVAVEFGADLRSSAIIASTVGAALKWVTPSRRRFQISSLFTLRRHTCVAPAAVTAQGKLQPLQWNIGSRP